MDTSFQKEKNHKIKNQKRSRDDTMAHNNTSNDKPFCEKCGEQRFTGNFGQTSKIYCPSCGRQLKAGIVEGMGLGEDFLTSISYATRLSGFGHILQVIHKVQNRFTGY